MLINVITGLYCIEFTVYTLLNFGPFFQNMTDFAVRALYLS